MTWGRRERGEVGVEVGGESWDRREIESVMESASFLGRPGLG